MTFLGWDKSRICSCTFCREDIKFEPGSLPCPPPPNNLCTRECQLGFCKSKSPLGLRDDCHTRYVAMNNNSTTIMDMCVSGNCVMSFHMTKFLNHMKPTCLTQPCTYVSWLVVQTYIISTFRHNILFGLFSSLLVPTHHVHSGTCTVLHYIIIASIMYLAKDI